MTGNINLSIKFICSVMFIFVVAVGPAFAQFYEYKDKNGNVVITDSPPPGSEAREKKISEGGVYRSTRSEKDYPASDPKGGPRGALSGGEKPKKNYSRVNVTMYMTEW